MARRSAPTPMMVDDGPRELTEFGQFVKDHHINARWLAEQLGVSPSRVSRWCWGLTGMSQAMRAEIMEVLRQRARDQEPPDGLLDDQPELPLWAERADCMPYDRALSALREP